MYILFVLPLGIFFAFSVYPLPKVQYVVLSLLVLFQYIYFNEKKVRQRIWPKITKKLKKELNRVPSNKEINARVNFIIDTQIWTVIMTGIGILFLMIFFQKF